ncbi:MAG: hypothetical protein A3F84_12575 [Candidatus Handelsmanbacteria bacterium RIFCSPLOWO2_12_FULL_64_10]|uniref:TIGR00374 family protein n=1 Tax=Handelsmanbacteria sp. (strain RIFCSPLOWO2_12_FULL_64_10) TaxID=1817868 RepID=A0A1F6D3P1_HANXR|nr:MAG: hypothetical protein A3F84_12575 [Candidatus Handelsmanbacteria bacterium RIFCSPLOWO2_12_FULL_64_10]
MKARALLTGLSLAAGAGVCVAALWAGPGEQPWTALQEASWPLLALALAVAVAEPLLRAVRLRVFTRALDGRLSLWTSARITLVGDFAAAITPSRLGGEPARLCALIRAGLSSGAAGAVLLGEFLTDLCALIFLVIVALGLSGSGAGPQAVWPSVALLAGGGAAIGLALRWPSILDRLWTPLSSRRPTAWALRKAGLEGFSPGRWAAEVRGRSGVLLAGRWRGTAVGGICALLHTTARFAVLPLLTAAFAVPLDLRSAILIQMAIFYGLALVPTPGGSGVPEIAFAAALSLSAPSAPVGLLLILWRFLTFYLGGAAGGVVSPGLFYAEGRRA